MSTVDDALAAAESDGLDDNDIAAIRACTSPVCERGCTTWETCDEPADCSADNAVRHDNERHGFGVCATGVCIEPCGPNGGCVR